MNTLIRKLALPLFAIVVGSASLAVAVVAHAEDVTKPDAMTTDAMAPDAAAPDAMAPAVKPAN